MRSRPAPIPLEPCWWCKGTGKTPSHANPGTYLHWPCPRCDGTGKIPALTEPALPGERP